MQGTTPAFLTVLLTAAFVGLPAVLLSAVSGSAVQQPKISFDMNADSNAYVPSADANFDGLPDAGSNVMTVGPIDNCFAHPGPADNAAHLHGFGGANTTDPRVQIVIENVEDVVAYQLRINFDGTKLAITTPAQINHTPFADGAVAINFLNLPVDEATRAHKSVFTAQDFPNRGTANANALIGAAALDIGTAGAAADVPPKAAHDEANRTYQANGGGVLAQVQFVVSAGQAGQSSLYLDLDDADPHAPGSKVDIFTPAGVQSINLAPADMGDGFHGEGVACQPPAQGPPGGPAPPPGPPGGVTPAPGAGDGGPGDGATDGAGPGDGTGTGTGTGGASPRRTASTTPTPDGETSGEDGTDNGGDGGGTPFWVFVLIAIVVALAGGGAYAAWRYRSRLPWLNR